MQEQSLVLKHCALHHRAMHAFLSFLAVGGLLLIVPGPDTFVVLRTALTDGPRAGTWAAAGSATGNFVWGMTSALGVAALLAASAAAFATLKLAGAAYLAVLGAQALRAALRGEPLTRDPAAGVALSRAAAFRRGLASDLLNVKAGLFWTALVPQFLSTDSSALLPVAMVTAMVGLVFAWLTGYAHLAARLSGTLKSRRAARAVNGGVGAVLVALGAALAVARHG
jgi:threonine/homoserine/homoserine lactone efflux protein